MVFFGASIFLSLLMRSFFFSFLVTVDVPSFWVQVVNVINEGISRKLNFRPLFSFLLFFCVSILGKSIFVFVLEKNVFPKHAVTSCRIHLFFFFFCLRGSEGH